MRVSVTLGVLLSVAGVAEACSNAGAGGHREVERSNTIPYREYRRKLCDDRRKDRQDKRKDRNNDDDDDDDDTQAQWPELSNQFDPSKGGYRQRGIILDWGLGRKKTSTTTKASSTSKTSSTSSTTRAASSSSSKAAASSIISSVSASAASASASSAVTSVVPSATPSSSGASQAASSPSVTSATPTTNTSSDFPDHTQTTVPVIPSSVEVETMTSAVPVPVTNGTSSATRVGGATVENHILVLARDEYAAESGFHGLEGYGIPYDRVLVPQGGVALPQLQSSEKHGRYSGIIVMDALSYEYAEGWRSAITEGQWKELHDYQVRFGVRMVRINEYPGPAFGASTTGGGGSGSEHDISLVDTSDFPTANLKAGAGLTARGLWHYPAEVTNSTFTKAVAKFAPDAYNPSETVAAVINKFDDGREQFVWFSSWAPQWSTTCAAFQHAHIHWLTRGLFLGKRKTHLSIQIDDLELPTDIYYPAGKLFRLRAEDLDGHVAWQTDLNSRLPAGSDVRLELGHNGNGDILAATSPSSNGVCNPDYAVDYPEVPGTALEFQKPLGTGVDFWPKEWSKYPWSYTCTQRDALTRWYANSAKRDAFFHVSHTFTHEGMNNATYRDAALEIQFNQAWLAQTGIAAGKFSPKGLIPPAITGLHNGDVIRAWMDNGIAYVVGDNTRPVLRSGESPYHPLLTTVEGNGYAGLTIIPRWATSIYYNCDTWECDVAEWKAISQGYGDYNDLLNNAREVNTPYLFALKADPYMFHQANLNLVDMPTITVGSKTGKMSMVMGWTEAVAQEVARVTNWPIVSLKHDDFAKYFIDRAALDACSPSLQYNFNTDGSAVISVTVTAVNANCPAEVPVTLPAGTASGSRMDKVGSEPPIAWVKLTGGSVTLQLSTPVQL